MVCVCVNVNGCIKTFPPRGSPMALQSSFLAVLAALAPDPSEVAQRVGNAFLLQSAPPEKTALGFLCPMVNGRPCGMMAWNYGGALIFDGMYQSIRQFGDANNWTAQLNDYLDRYAKSREVPGYNLSHNITIPWEYSIGDYTGLFPIAYLQRALLATPPSLSGPDIAMANLTANHYILEWPHRLSDGTFSRLGAGDWPGEHSSANGSIVWADDQTMGTMLLARMAPLFRQKRYADEVARQQVGFSRRLTDPADGLIYHGYNEADGHESCCKWGRANGWGMLGHSEAVASMAAWPEGYPDRGLNEQIKHIFRVHAQAAKATQSSDGRWRQLVNDSSAPSFLETSTTAMFLAGLVRGVRLGVLDPREYAPTISKAWSGLNAAILPNGTVTGVCCGTGIQPNAEAYFERKTFYGCSGPGGAGAVLYAAVEIAKATADGLLS